MTARQLVWDMDGTLLDTTEIVPAAFLAAVRRLNGPAVDAQQVVASYSLGTAEVILAHLLGRTLAPGEEEVYYRELAAARPRPYPQVADVLAALRLRGRPIAVFTGASTRAARTLLGAAGLEVDLLIGGDEAGRPKPSPDGLLLVAKRIGVAAAGLAYIGDSPLDLRAAKAAGCCSAAAAWGHQYDPSEPADCTLTTPAQALTLLGEPGQMGVL